VGSIIGTNVAPPEPRTAVQLSHSNKLLYCRLIGGGFSDRGHRRSIKTQTDIRSSNCVRITASSVPLGLRVLDRKPGIRQPQAPIEFPRTTDVLHGLAHAPYGSGEAV
jgi:hypothetical protein